MIYSKRKMQRVSERGRMRVQCGLLPETYRMLTALTGSGPINATITRLIEEEFARIQTPVRKAQLKNEDAVYLSVMNALKR